MSTHRTRSRSRSKGHASQDAEDALQERKETDDVAQHTNAAASAQLGSAPPQRSVSSRGYEDEQGDEVQHEQSLYAPVRTSSMAPPQLQTEAQFPVYKKAMQAMLVDQGLWEAVVNPPPSQRGVRSMIGAMNEDRRSDLRSVADGLGEEHSVPSGSTRADAMHKAAGNRAYLLLLMSLSKSPEAQAIVYDVPQGNAHELWSRVVSHFEGLSELSKSYLLTEFSALRMKSGESVALYAARVKKIVMSLAAVGVNIDSTMMIHQLVSGLESPRFDLARNMLSGLNAATDMSFEKVQTYLRSQEIQMMAEPSKKPKGITSANFAPASRPGPGFDKAKNVVCWNCNERGHFSDKCTKPKASGHGGGKFGGAKQHHRGGRPAQSGNGKICTYCGIEGHDEAQCHHKARAAAMASSKTVYAKPAASLGVQVARDRGVKNANYAKVQVAPGRQKIVNALVAISVARKEQSANSALSSEVEAATGQSWHLDSGAARHNAPCDVPLESPVVNDELRIRVASGEVLDSPVEGDLMVHTSMADRPLHLRSVLTHERMSARLLSVSQTCASPIVAGVWFDISGAQVITITGEVLLSAHQEDGVYVVDGCRYGPMSGGTVAAESSETKPASARKANAGEQNIPLWHHRFAHLGVTGMARLASVNAVEGLESIAPLLRVTAPAPEKLGVCKGCAQGKAHRAPLGKDSPPEWVKAQHPMDRWHADLFGPFPPSLGGKAYLLLITDEASNKTFGFTIAQKSESAACIMECCRRAKVLHGRPLKEFHSDGGGEFRSQELLDFWSSEGTVDTVTMPHTPQHNPIAERKGRTIVEATQSQLRHAGAPVELWGEAALTAVHVLNMVAVQAHVSHTANQRYHPRGLAEMREKVHGLRTLFCDAWVHVPDADRTKLEAKSRICIFFGYPDDALGYRFYDVEVGRVVRSRDATFVEGEFTQSARLRQILIMGDDRPGAGKVDAQSYDEYLDGVFSEANLKLGMILSAAEVQPPAADGQCAPPSVPSQDLVEPTAPSEQSSKTKSVLFRIDESLFDDESDHDSDPDDAAYAPVSRAIVPNEPVRHSSRVSARTNHYGMVDFGDVAAFAAGLRPKGTGLSDPTTLAEMRSAPDAALFEKSIEEEHASLLSKEVMVEVEPDEVPYGMKPLPSKYVFKRKIDEEGEVSRRKTRLVAMGILQRAGHDFDEENLYAPTLHCTSLRVVMDVVTELDYELSGMDVKTAFLNASLSEEVYITLPRGAKDGLRADGTPRVFRLLKALYGLKQAPKAWNDEFDGTLTKVCGFTRLVTDSCVYRRLSRTGRVILLVVFVDDTVAGYHKEDEVEWLEIKKKITDKYEVSDGGECTFLLGMRIRRERAVRSLTIDQASYVERLLEKTEMHRCIPVSSPEEPGVRLTAIGHVSSHEGRNGMNPKESPSEDLDPERRAKYGSFVGGLLYAAVWTRPDIAHAVGELTRFISNPKTAHWNACMRVLRYLKGAPGLGLTYRREDGATGEAIVLGPVFADASYATDPEKRRSTTGLVVKMGGGAVAWSSVRQKVVTLSSCEAEYLALGEATKQVMWLRQMLKEIGYEQREPTVMLGDNEASIRTAYNDTHHTRMKHIDIRHHFIREQVQDKTIALAWVPTQKQQADILTKGLGKNTFNYLRGLVMGAKAGGDDDEGGGAPKVAFLTRIATHPRGRSRTNLLAEPSSLNIRLGAPSIQAPSRHTQIDPTLQWKGAGEHE